MSNLDNINPPEILNHTGTLHPINQTKDYLLQLLSKIGFEEVHAWRANQSPGKPGTLAIIGKKGQK